MSIINSNANLIIGYVKFNHFILLPFCFQHVSMTCIYLKPLIISMLLIFNSFNTTLTQPTNYSTKLSIPKLYSYHFVCGYNLNVTVKFVTMARTFKHIKHYN